MSTNYAKRTYVLSGTFVAVAAPWNANFCGYRNRGTNPITVRTTVSDPATEDVLDPGVQEAIVGEPYGGVGGVRFLGDDVVFYAKSDLGSLLTVTWVK